MYRIRLGKENFKFSCSHFTILGKNQAERLHGHNYYVAIELTIEAVKPDLGMAFDFNAIKPLVRAITNELDERVLLPSKSPYLKIENPSAESVRAILGPKRYEFPSDDVAVLPVSNITSEELAKLITERLASDIKKDSGIGPLSALEVSVEETRGQSVSFAMRMV